MATDQLPDFLERVGTSPMRVVDVHWSTDRVDVRFQLDEGTGKSSSWKLRFRGILEQCFTVVTECGLAVWRRDHPAIDQYLQPRKFLHFSAPPTDPHAVVGQLLAAHVALADDWIPFDRYLTRESPLAELLALGEGRLATGPAFLIAAYAEVLERAGCTPRIGTLPRRRKIEHAVLAHFGESFVVAERISAQRLPD